MANTITNVLPTMLAQGLRALRQQAITTRLVNRNYDALAAQPGNVINVPIPSALSANTVTPAAALVTSTAISPTAAVVTLDFWREARFAMSDNDIASVMNGTIAMQQSEAIKALGNAIDVYLLGKYTGVYGWAGTAGTTPFASGTTLVGTARNILNRQLAPISDRRAVLDADAEAALLGTTNVLQFDQRGDPQGIIEGSIGRKYGIDWYLNQNVVTHTAGTAWLTGYSVATGGATAGNSTMTVINTTIASGTIVVGDVFSVAGSMARYVITVAAAAATATATAAANVAINFSPALATTVASGAVVTVVGSHVVNLTFHRDAFAWASRPLSALDGAGLGLPGADAMVSTVDEITGIALRLEVAREYKQWSFSYDVLGGAGLIRAELACRILG